jgi:hypothetical protein
MARRHPLAAPARAAEEGGEAMSDSNQSYEMLPCTMSVLVVMCQFPQKERQKLYDRMILESYRNTDKARGERIRRELKETTGMMFYPNWRRRPTKEDK